MEEVIEEAGFSETPPLKKANRLKGRDAKPRGYELTTPTAHARRAAKGGHKRDQAGLINKNSKGGPLSRLPSSSSKPYRMVEVKASPHSIKNTIKEIMTGQRSHHDEARDQDFVIRNLDGF